MLCTLLNAYRQYHGSGDVTMLLSIRYGWIFGLSEASMQTGTRNIPHDRIANGGIGAMEIMYTCRHGGKLIGLCVVWCRRPLRHRVPELRTAGLQLKMQVYFGRSRLSGVWSAGPVQKGEAR